MKKKLKKLSKHTKKVVETDEMYKGDTKVKQEGSDGQRR